MTITLSTLHISSEHPKELGEFYQKILGLAPEWQSEQGMGFLVGDTRLLILSHDKVHGKNSNPERLIFDLNVDNVAAEFKRVVGLGAVVVQEPYTLDDDSVRMTLATLADPDGNYFQLLSSTPI